RARSGIRIAWQQACMALRDMQHNRSGFEESEIAFFIGWNLSERMKRQMRGFLHLFDRQKTNVVSLAHFFERPTNAHVPRQSPATIGRLLNRLLKNPFEPLSQLQAPLENLEISHSRSLETAASNEFFSNLLKAVMVGFIGASEP